MPRRETCPKCGRDARVCLNCRHYDRSAYRECREEQAEWVKDKEAGNFCSYFEAGANGSLSSGRSTDTLKAKLEAAFSKGPVSLSEGEATSKPSGSISDELAKFLNSKK